MQLISLVVSVMLGPLSAALLVVADTWEGRACATSGLALIAGLLLILFGRTTTQLRRRIAVALGVLGVACVGIVIAHAPSGAPGTPARVRHLYRQGEHHPRWALSNLVPEGDQFELGTIVMPFVDPLLTHRQAAPLRSWIREIYGEMEAEADFHELGSVLGQAYSNLWSGDARQHAFMYVPTSLDRSKPAAALVFFHGSGGNFKAYTWLLAKVADRMGLVLIAPSCGMGNWTPAETHKRMAAALQATQEVVSIDKSRIHVMGLSNGGMAVSQMMVDAARSYRSFTFISPVFHDESVRTFANGPGELKPRVRIVSGELDNRVPWSYVEKNADDLRRAGADVILKSFSDADHFLLFSHRDRVVALLQEWLLASQ
jgi:predicted esterase